jgi:hypothetical protein
MTFMTIPKSMRRFRNLCFAANLAPVSMAGFDLATVIAIAVGNTETRDAVNLPHPHFGFELGRWRRL